MALYAFGFEDRHRQEEALSICLPLVHAYVYMPFTCHLPHNVKATLLTWLSPAQRGLLL